MLAVSPLRWGHLISTEVVHSSATCISDNGAAWWQSAGGFLGSSAPHPAAWISTEAAEALGSGNQRWATGSWPNSKPLWIIEPGPGELVCWLLVQLNIELRVHSSHRLEGSKTTTTLPSTLDREVSCLGESGNSKRTLKFVNLSNHYVSSITFYLYFIPLSRHRWELLSYRDPNTIRRSRTIDLQTQSGGNNGSWWDDKLVAIATRNEAMCYHVLLLYVSHIVKRFIFAVEIFHSRALLLYYANYFAVLIFVQAWGFVTHIVLIIHVEIFAYIIFTVLVRPRKQAE